MSVDQDIANLKKRLDEVNTKRIQTTTKLASLDEEKNKLLAECTSLGVPDPKKIEEFIASQEALLNSELEKIKADLSQTNALTA